MALAVGILSVVDTLMKAILAIVAAILLVVLGFGIIVMNIHALTIPLLIFSGLSIALALGLAIPADLKSAIVIIAPYIPDALAGGRRRTDPPPPDHDESH